jgi:NADP-dependent 3-hydroxy acid dehydrogenase YdfG
MVNINSIIGQATYEKHRSHCGAKFKVVQDEVILKINCKRKDIAGNLRMLLLVPEKEILNGKILPWFPPILYI